MAIRRRGMDDPEIRLRTSFTLAHEDHYVFRIEDPEHCDKTIASGLTDLSLKLRRDPDEVVIVADDGSIVGRLEGNVVKGDPVASDIRWEVEG